LFAKYMRRNIGDSERGLRSTAGVAFAALALFADLDPGWALLAFIAGIAFLVTALASYCPVNAVLGRDSRRNESALR
jgi:hypothetical protein